MNMVYITDPPSEGDVSRLFYLCSPFAECIGDISLRNKTVVIEFHVFPVAPTATTITFNRYHYCFIIFILLHLVAPCFGPFLGHDLPIARVSKPLTFHEVNLSFTCPIPNMEYQGLSLSGMSLQTCPTWVALPAARP
jgi:hypothetical protein